MIRGAEALAIKTDSIRMCRDCGSQVHHYVCNYPLELFRDSLGWDWWAACDSPLCQNHEGEGIFQDDPEWEINVESTFDALAKAVTDLEDYLHTIGGCGDGYCIIEKPKGMHTNGSCQCSENRYKMQRYAFAQNRFTAKVKAILGEK